MTVDDIRTLLRDAVADVHADPDLGGRIVRPTRHRRRRIGPVVAVAMSVLLLLGLIGGVVALTRSGSPPAAPASTPTPPPTDAAALPTGPEGPMFFGGDDTPSLVIGKVHSLGPAIAADGRKALTLVLFVRLPVPADASPDLAVNLCSTRWVPGTPLADATIDRCVGGSPADEPPVDGPAALLRPPAEA